MEFILLGTVFNGGVLCCTMLVIIFLAFLARRTQNKFVVTITNEQTDNEKVVKEVIDALQNQLMINEYQVVGVSEVKGGSQL